MFNRFKKFNQSDLRDLVVLLVTLTAMTFGIIAAFFLLTGFTLPMTETWLASGLLLLAAKSFRRRTRRTASSRAAR